MDSIDGKMQKWSVEQTPRVQRVFNKDFMQFAVDASPLRTARRNHQDTQREERLKKRVLTNKEMRSTISSSMQLPYFSNTLSFDESFGVTKRESDIQLVLD